MKKITIIQGSLVNSIKNVVLTKEEREEVDKCSRKIRKLKLPKKMLF